MPEIFAKLHISSPYTAGVSYTKAACGPRGRTVLPAVLFVFFRTLTFVLFSLFTGVEKCSSSETTSDFQTNTETARNDLTTTHDIFCKK